MPNEINPNDYNIDFFSTNFIGTTSVESFRDYLFSKNLQELPPELINGAAGNFSSDYEEKGLEKAINYTSIVNPGDIDEWLVEGNFPVTSHQIRDIGMLQGNAYGPPTIEAYNAPELIPEDTGFVQYPTSSGGDDYLQLLLTSQINGLGFGPGAAINFPSKLNDIAKERRKEEAINRLTNNLQNNTIGTINLDPFGLLAGQDLFLRDYKITRFPGIVGQTVDFASQQLNFEIPVSPIPKGAFGTWGTNDDAEAYKALLDSTAAGTKSLIYNAVAKNKYGPTLGEPKGGLANTLGVGQPPQLNGYTDNIDDVLQTNINQQKNKPLVDKVNQAIGNAINNIVGNAGIGKEDEDLSPYEFENPTVTDDPIVKNAEIGIDTLYNSSDLDTWAKPGPTDIPTQDPDGPIGTKIPFTDEDWIGGASNAGSKNQGVSYDRGMYWGSHTVNPFKRGLLKYTQDMVNQSKGSTLKTKSRYIGVTNDPENYEATTGRHSKYSMGNTVTDSQNTYYCRSWSVRNPYRKVSDLIRHGVNNGTASLTRPDLNLSVLDTNGFVKITPYIGDAVGGYDNGVLKLGNPAVQKYMLSIENLAWQNTEHLLKLPKCEVGPNGGRIMWFPPYNISFTDNSSINWDATTFIGRGEPVYTYNNTERTGTLSFTLIVDHSMAVAKLKNENASSEALFRYFAGCEDPVEEARTIIPPSDFQEIVIQESQTTLVPGTPEVVIETTTPVNPPVNEIQFYFRNARYFEQDSVGTVLTTELGPNADEKPPNYIASETKLWPNGYLCGSQPSVLPLIIDLNTGLPVPNPAFTGTAASNYTNEVYNSLNTLAINNLDSLIDFLLSPDGKRYKIKIVGKTSDAGPKSGKKSNENLGKKRADTTKDYILNKLIEREAQIGPIKATNLSSEKTYPTEKEWSQSDLRWIVTTTGEQGANLSVSVDNKTGDKSARIEDNRKFGDSLATVPDALKNRTSVITLEYNPNIDDQFVGQGKPAVPDSYITTTKDVITKVEKNKEEVKQEELLKQLSARATEYLAWECSYFEKMEQNDPFIYETLKEKIRHFHPAFHSMTPEGFNARLTFLKQCTRQGPNVAVGEPSNMAFGKPPICVLRIGDFYHTKIVIDSVNFSFDPIQWDLNPEGIGVQPMLCNVDLNFKFIGGSSLGGPISQLQNAVGFNFFANTGLYQARTIYKSVGEYKVSRPDPVTGIYNEIKSNTGGESEIFKTSAGGKDVPFGFGAYLVPGQVSNESSAFVQESLGTPPKDVTKDLAKEQQAAANVTPKDATPSSEVLAATEEGFNNVLESSDPEATINQNNDGDNLSGTDPAAENKSMPGLDKKTGKYKTQYTQNLKVKSKTTFSQETGNSVTIATSKVSKIIIPKGTILFRDVNKKEGDNLIIFVNQTQEVNSSVSKGNRITTTCARSDFKYTDGGLFENEPFLNVIKQVFCNGKKDKTWKELTS